VRDEFETKLREKDNQLNNLRSQLDAANILVAQLKTDKDKLARDAATANQQAEALAQQRMKDSTNDKSELAKARARIAELESQIGTPSPPAASLPQRLATPQAETNSVANTCPKFNLQDSNLPKPRLIHKCLIVFQGRTYLDASCEFRVFPDKGYLISAVGKASPRYAAYWRAEDHGGKKGIVHGCWTGPNAVSFDDLGLLQWTGACGENSTARLCAFQEK
jgi:hypothetical protein